MENNKLTPEQILEVNARVKEVIENFREGLCNSAAFDYGNYFDLCMRGNNEMSKACKHVYDTKKRIVDMIDKEVMLVENDNRQLYYEEKRKVKDIIIGKLMSFVKPYLMGRDRDERQILERVVNLTEFAIESGEKLNDITNRGKYFSNR